MNTNKSSRNDSRRSLKGGRGVHPYFSSCLYTMFNVVVATISILILNLGIAFGQRLEMKDLVFPQVVVGPGIESTVSVTNPGQVTYEGNLQFWSGLNQDWNPEVNGARVKESSLQVAINSGETRIFRITDSKLAAGAASFEAEDRAIDNLVQGNLTYWIQGYTIDSVGIAPASEFLRAVIPFAEFSTVALALGNPDRDELSVVTLHLFDELGSMVETVTTVLRERSHEARFLSEIFDAETETGRVILEATRQVIGTALTVSDYELSALPVIPSPVTYEFRTSNQGEIDLAELVLWLEGTFAKGYLRFFEVDGNPILNPENYLVSGPFTDGDLRLTQYGAGPIIGGEETVSYLMIRGFNFDKRSWKGEYVRILNGYPFRHVIEGEFQLTRN